MDSKRWCCLLSKNYSILNLGEFFHSEKYRVFTQYAATTILRHWATMSWRWWWPSWTLQQCGGSSKTWSRSTRNGPSGVWIRSRWMYQLFHQLLQMTPILNIICDYNPWYSSKSDGSSRQFYYIPLLYWCWKYPMVYCSYKRTWVTGIFCHHQSQHKVMC